MVTDSTSYKFLETDSGKVNNKATSRASQTYAANHAATGGTQFDYPKTLKAVLLFIQPFDLSGLFPPCVVFHVA